MNTSKTKRMALISASMLTAVLAAGCADKKTPEQQREWGELRHKVFTECMELAAKNGMQGDDDVSDLVSECGSQSYYMTNGILGG